MDSYKTIKLWSSAILLLLFNLINVELGAEADMEYGRVLLQ